MPKYTANRNSSWKDQDSPLVLMKREKPYEYGLRKEEGPRFVDMVGKREQIEKRAKEDKADGL